MQIRKIYKSEECISAKSLVYKKKALTSYHKKKALPSYE